MELSAALTFRKRGNFRRAALSTTRRSLIDAVRLLMAMPKPFPSILIKRRYFKLPEEAAAVVLVAVAAVVVSAAAPRAEPTARWSAHRNSARTGPGLSAPSFAPVVDYSSSWFDSPGFFDPLLRSLCFRNPSSLPRKNFSLKPVAKAMNR